MNDTRWPDGQEPAQPTTDAAGWLSRLLDNPSDVVLQQCKAWFDSAADHQSAFANAMFATPMPDIIRHRIEERLGKKFPSLHVADAPARPSAVVTPINAARRATGQRRTEDLQVNPLVRPRWRSIAWAGAAIAAAIGLTVTFAPQLLPVPFFSAAHAETLATGRGMIRSFDLTDGSSVTLDANSRVVVTIDHARRHASLRLGRARFSIKHDARPFTIDAGSGQIASMDGTIDVAIETSDHVDVSLRSGAATMREVDTVAAKQVRDSQPLAIDQPISYALTAFHPEPIVSPRMDTKDWPDGWVSSRAITLAALVADANRYAAEPITLDNAELGQLKVNGRFKLTDTNGFVSRIAELYDLVITRKADSIHLASQEMSRTD